MYQFKKIFVVNKKLNLIQYSNSIYFISKKTTTKNNNQKLSMIECNNNNDFIENSMDKLSVDSNANNNNITILPENIHGHFFMKKTFHKPTYCHHCAEMLWGLIGQGFVCEGLDDFFCLF
jgi:hypothetical protein